MKRDLEIIRELQLVQLRSLKKLDEICRRHDIRYWVAYGTLLGAIRHQGFIPWDDDLDIGIMREDYEKLCAVPAEEWDDGSILLTPESDDERHDKIFARVYQDASCVQSLKDVKNWRRWSDGKTWSTSLMMDVFLFDYVPDDDEEQKRLFRKLHYGYAKQYTMVKLKAKFDRSSLRSAVRSGGKIAYGWIMRHVHRRPWVTLWNRYKKAVEKSHRGSRIGVYCTIDPYTYDASEVFPLKTAKFEDMEVPIPGCWDKMLTDMYGDYMQFPPESERTHINFVYIDLGDGRKYVIDPVPGSLGAES